MAPHPKFGNVTNNEHGEYDWKFGGYKLESADPREGVTSWEALYHFIDKIKASELYELVLGGYDDESLIDPNWWPEERQEFERNAFRIRRLLMDMDGQVWRQLRLGELLAYGFSNLAPLDAGRRLILAERWQDLVLNLRESAASGPGIEITQILIFPGKKTEADNAKSSRRVFSDAALRRWYLDRIDTCAADQRRPSREDDYREANAEFKGNVPKRTVEAVRRELAPAHWTRKGRPRRPS